MTSDILGDPTLDALLAASDVAAGDVLDGKFLIKRCVGEGAFGRVYEAEDLRLGRRVALKVVFGQAQPRHAKLLRSEVDVMRSIEHGNVVRLYDFGESSGGLLYLCMEFVEGYDLAELIWREGALGVERTIRIALQVLDALSETEKIGVVHLDIKPQNIILTEEGVRADVVKLVDFGIAKELARATTASSMGVARGTPLYMAPEQLRNEQIGPHTDVYALGLITYEMLTGEPAFADEDSLAILVQKASRSIRVPDGLVQPGVADVINRSLKRDHRRRFPTARAMYVAMLAAIDGANPTSGSTSPPPHEQWKRLPTAAASAQPQSTGQFKKPAAGEQSTPGEAASLAASPSPGESSPPGKPLRRRTMEMTTQQLDEVRVKEQRAEHKEELPLISIRKRKARPRNVDKRAPSPLGMPKVVRPTTNDGED